MHRWLPDDSDDNLQTPTDTLSSTYSVSKRQLLVQRALIEIEVLMAPLVVLTVPGLVVQLFQNQSASLALIITNSTIFLLAQLVHPVIRIEDLSSAFQQGCIYWITSIHHFLHSVGTLSQSSKYDTAILKTGKQAQRITNADGYVFGLSIKSGLAYLKMRPFTTQEYESLPHVIMTSDK